MKHGDNRVDSIDWVVVFVTGRNRRAFSLRVLDYDDRPMLWVRLAAWIPLIIALPLYLFVFPSPFIFGALLGGICAGIAWFWPVPGGILMLLLTVPGFYPLVKSNYDLVMKIPAYIFIVSFGLSGALHLYAGVGLWVTKFRKSRTR